MLLAKSSPLFYCYKKKFHRVLNLLINAHSGPRSDAAIYQRLGPDPQQAVADGGRGDLRTKQQEASRQVAVVPSSFIVIGGH
jgi:hypothetical protein